MLATLQGLGVAPSFNIPLVSNDNTYSESVFKTLKYRSEQPEKAFLNIDTARHWVKGSVQWYNNQHQHSNVKFVPPAQRRSPEDMAISLNRKRVYAAARAHSPIRWSGDVKN